MTITYDEIRTRINVDHITMAAAWAAEEVAEHGVAHVKLTPGDGTLYPIIVVKARVWNCDQYGHVDEPREYTVTLAASFGATYQWGGQPLHEDYVGEKWTSDGNKWTATVVAAFLNAFSEYRGTGLS